MKTLYISSMVVLGLGIASSIAQANFQRNVERKLGVGVVNHAISKVENVRDEALSCAESIAKKCGEKDSKCPVSRCCHKLIGNLEKIAANCNRWIEDLRKAEADKEAKEMKRESKKEANKSERMIEKKHIERKAMQNEVSY